MKSNLINFNKKIKNHSNIAILSKLIHRLGGTENILSFSGNENSLEVHISKVRKVKLEKISNYNFVNNCNIDNEKVIINLNNITSDSIVYEWKNLLKIKQVKLADPNVIKWNHSYSTNTNVLSFIKYYINEFAKIFIPLIPLFVCGGFPIAIATVIKFQTDLTTNNAALISYTLFNTLGNTVMGALPVFVGYTAAKKWGGNPWFGAAVGLVLIIPTINLPEMVSNKLDFHLFNIPSTSDINESTKTYYLWDINNLLSQQDAGNKIPVLWNNGIKVWNFPIFSIPIIGYKSQIIPILFAVLLMVRIEKFLRRVTPDCISTIFIPLLTVVPIVVLTFALIAPIGYIVSSAVSQFLNLIFIYTNFPYFGLGGAILGASYAPLVVTGLHQGFPPIELQLLATKGESWITLIAGISNIAQGFACLVGALFVQDKKTKNKALQGAASANLGIAEVALFGFNINVKTYFIGALIGGACGGYWLGMTQTTVNTLGNAGWIGVIQFDVSRDVPNVANWYEYVSKATPWGNHMQGFNLPPIVNGIISYAIGGISAAIASFFLSFSKLGRKELKEINKDLPNYAWIDNADLFLQKLSLRMEMFFDKLFGQKYANKKIAKKIQYIYSPIDGEVVQISNGDNQIGSTFTIRNKDNQYNLYSPINGKLVNVTHTGHQLVIRGKKNFSILVNVGDDVSKLNQECKSLKNLNFLKFNKLINNKVEHYLDINQSSRNKISDFISKMLTSKKNNKLENHIVNIDSKNLIDNGAKSTDISISVLNETSKENRIKILINENDKVIKGQPIFKVINNNLKIGE